ncbi:testis-expressed protein 2-like [Paramacrobiotus metropolitanus]|uniref:testis-expressed protein 2-like n=1 Tax=Paramacrobiotus metropolitanus TaxID=2943436 RepID=UPI0024457724|nr:testis-expressed protein 2-like [Paramacrobiotus metropolitanus]
MAAPQASHTVIKTTTVTNVPVVHDATSRTPEQLLDRLVEFNKHVDHIARVEAILMHDMGLSKEDADVFIRSGVDGVFGRLPSGPSAQTARSPSHAGPDARLKTPDSTVGIWMNELTEDFDEKKYFLERTKPILVNFEQSTLRIRRPNHRVVPRMAFFNEHEKQKLEDVTWTEEREYDLRNADVFLLPFDVPVKIRWLCRFPIGIKLKELGQAAGELVVEAQDKDTKFLKKDASTLILFARCDREKEELFWRFITASGKTPYRFAMPSVNISPDMTVLTAFVHRVGADILVDPLWRKILFEKFGQKLGQIKRPYYLEELKLTDLNLGRSLPTFGEVSRDIRVDRLGLWFEVDFEMRGPITITLETSMNVLKMTHPEEKGKENSGSDDRARMAYGTLSSLYGGYVDDDEFEEETEMPEKAKPKAMRLMEYIAESKAFKYFSEIGFIKKSLEEVSDTTLTVNIEIKLIKGRMAMNLPHPPSDRLWYGFIPAPEFDLVATPLFGDKKIDFTMVTDFLEKTMTKQFHQIFTIPNMDDITVPFANSGIDPEEYRMAKLRDLVVKLA